MAVLSSCLGFPRIGANRELKRALESYWNGKSSAGYLLQTASDLRERHWSQIKSAGIDHIPCNDFSLYDQMLDMAVMVGAIPRRYRAIDDPLTQYFAMARGMQDEAQGVDVQAMEMTKWFDTNYHYLVPELEPDQQFTLDASKLINELTEAKSLDIAVRPVVIGPVTFLMLSKTVGDVSTLEFLESLLPVYEELLEILVDNGVEWVQLDEPCLALDLDNDAWEAYRVSLDRLTALVKRPRIMVATYFGPLRENMSLVTQSGCEGLHIDVVRAREQLDQALEQIGSETVLSLGVVDGRNVWRTNLDEAHALIGRAVVELGEERVIVATSCSLLHVPFDLNAEPDLDPELKTWLAFAVQKLDEVKSLAVEAASSSPESDAFTESRQALAVRAVSPRVRDSEVRKRVGEVDESMLRRATPFAERARKQRARFKLPALPTTTIGSFPQTGKVRRARAAWRSGKTADADYLQFVKEETRRCIEKQLELGLDMLVHGEFERNDMVEFFGEQLSGFAFTSNGWVQSYGSRCVKPPVLYGDVSRSRPMTVDIARYAQSLTTVPVKGMITGPVTILQWSFVRDDQPRRDTCMQVALALRGEVMDLEAAGITVIQVDEPAIREGLPLRRDDRDAYLKWAVESFRLTTAGVLDDTQIHTHMCYSEFGDILKAIGEMDADVLSIETSRSRMELLGDFAEQGYPNDVGPGVYDIHSPRVPSVEEMTGLLKRAAKVLPVDRLWVNPDCGLKTRGWPEVEMSLRNMVEAARQVRTELTGASK
ncbi:MAG: 5-methyltetrahydropteroyltriglutamate--homocysteine S-methyltransferase [Chloroflexi bacterium]|nr:5-methyltetrahydropteroyltriglutamate--homocysteine S-methyltransferase [Chloroflexota bacterium]MCI0871920.1 5-methyltetrahydropteroyltriglutamate--homocysteine S-methyltransferase [Chloroflexota bacterium]MCI0880938.1 5-methyltetrahydropteroyltriglutamate--homocysteine S-methyltransferase [Chloroflexota bacterium]